jgi:hypothetical protein
MNFHKLANALFSNKLDGKYKILRILGLKITLRNWNHYDQLVADCAEKISYLERMFDVDLRARSSFAVRPNSILLIEANDNHGDAPVAYARYLLDLDYNIDIILRPTVYERNPLCRLKDEKARVITLPMTLIKRFLEEQNLDKYQKIFFTSQNIYQRLNNNTWPTIFDHFPVLAKHMNQVVAVEHHFDKVNLELLRRDKVITLADFNKKTEHPISVTPISFGEVSITPKSANSIVNFIVVGGINYKRRNYSLLIDAVRELYRKGRNDFMVTLVGDGELDVTPQEVQKYFNIKGGVDFPAMYEAMEDADFFLPLLDPQNPHHRRYLTTGSSGSFQLIHAFRKPCLIHETFAAKYGFNDENSLVYRNDKEFIQTMSQATDMGQVEYATLQAGLEKLTQSVYARSIETLKRIIENDNRAIGQLPPCHWR